MLFTINRQWEIRINNVDRKFLKVIPIFHILFHIFITFHWAAIYLSQDGNVREDDNQERKTVHHEHAEEHVDDLQMSWGEWIEGNTLLVPPVVWMTLYVEHEHLTVKATFIKSALQIRSNVYIERTNKQYLTAYR